MLLVFGSVRNTIGLRLFPGLLTASLLTAHYSSFGSVAVMIRLVGTVDRDADILRLLFGQGRELGADFRQV